MNSNLLFDFIVDKEKNTLTVRREFAGPRPLVWDCYTKQELLDQWYAPAPFTARTKSMDFREGGHWHYAMIGPDGTEYWGYTEYKKIKPIDYYTLRDAFSDADGTINTELPKADWQVTFSDMNAHTQVETVMTYPSLADLEKVVQMGIENGISATMSRLDELLASLHS